MYMCSNFICICSKIQLNYIQKVKFRVIKCKKEYVGTFLQTLEYELYEW